MTKIRNAAIDPAVRTDAEAPLAEAKSLIVFCDKSTGAVVALSTDVEKQRGRIAGHFFNDYTAYEGQPLTASPQIGQPFKPE